MSLLSSLSFTMVILFVSYVVAIVVPFLRRTPSDTGDAGGFEWHFFIPCRDEEAVIATTIDRARRDFPDAHVWVVDDDSDDHTGDIVASRAADDRFVHLVQRRRPAARTGKGDALNSAYRSLLAWLPSDRDHERVVVAVLDADGELAPGALSYMAAADVFGNPAVGAAQTSVLMKNRDDLDPRPGEGRWARWLARWLIRMQDLEFRATIPGMQLLRVRTGSVGLGGNGQFTRLSVLDDIARETEEPWHGALLEDYEIGVHVLLAGYENRYVHDTFVAQEALGHGQRLLTQRTRWAQGNLQCVSYLPQLFRSRHLATSAVLESGYYLILPYLQLLGTLVFPILLVTSFRGSLIAPEVGVLLLPLVLFFGVLPFAAWGPIYRRREAPWAPRWLGLVWGLVYFVYIHYIYITVWRAALRLVLRRSGWAKTRRNAEVVVSGPVAKEA
jgi:1,2-diacylglycerol 3-beta-glucosyltransferase